MVVLYVYTVPESSLTDNEKKFESCKIFKFVLFILIWITLSTITLIFSTNYKNEMSCHNTNNNTNTSNNSSSSHVDLSETIGPYKWMLIHAFLVSWNVCIS